MNKIAQLVCKNRRIILLIALLLLIPSIIGIKLTRINYDILIYLPSDVETMKGENILSEEFNMGGYSIVLVNNMSIRDIEKLEEKIKEIDNVEKVVSIADIVRN